MLPHKKYYSKINGLKKTVIVPVLNKVSPHLMNSPLVPDILKPQTSNQTNKQTVSVFGFEDSRLKRGDQSTFFTNPIAYTLRMFEIRDVQNRFISFAKFIFFMTRRLVFLFLEFYFTDPRNP